MNEAMSDVQVRVRGGMRGDVKAEGTEGGKPMRRGWHAEKSGKE